MKKIKFVSLFILMISVANAQHQHERWQQRVHYKMDINVDAVKNQFTGKQHIDYWNNSPDTLKVLFFHLPWNAFQPGSMMDMRSQEIGKRLIRGRGDWDQRVRDRISKLKPDTLY